MANYKIPDNFSLLSKLINIRSENSFSSKTYSIEAHNIEKKIAQLSCLTQEKILNAELLTAPFKKKL